MPRLFASSPIPSAKRIHLAIHSMFSFWKHQDAVSAIHGLTRISETLPEASLAGQRK